MHKIIFFVSLMIVACKYKAVKPTSEVLEKIEIENKALDTASFGIKTTPRKLAYKTLKNEIQAARISLKKAYFSEKISLDSVQQYFENQLLNGLIPYWYGTPWSFEGHTDRPQEGEIACGYFVSTTLKHMRLAINRYKMAQKSPLEEAKYLNEGEEPTIIKAETAKEAIAEILVQFPSGLLFVGLEQSHVGYLLIRKNTLFFIHSNYHEPAEVILELASESPVFNSFSTFYLVPISNNEALVKRWLIGK